MSSYYTIGLLNDLHNYFPDLLYADVNRFPTVQSVLEYIRFEALTRHDLYSNARRHHNSVVTQQQNQNHPNDIFRFVFNMNEPTNEEMSDAENRNPLSDIMRLVQYAMAPPPPAFMEPVIVRPTSQQITANSTIVEVTTNEVCAICQENMASVDPIRRLNHCQHLFHDECISAWFQQNVHCPTCRHDVRVT